MRKVLSLLLLFGILGGFLMPAVVSAVEPPETCKLRHDITVDGATYNEGQTVGPPGSGADNEIEDWGLVCILNAIHSAASWIFIIVMALVTVLIVVGGLFIMTAGGNEERIATGRSYVIYAIIGLVIALVARLIPSMVETILGM